MTIALSLGFSGGLLFAANCAAEFYCPIAFSFTHLGALKSEQMAGYEPPSTELLDADYRHQTSFFWGSLAGVTRTFRLTDPNSKGEALEDFRNEALANGWTPMKEHSFCKELDPGIAIIIISFRDAGDFGATEDRIVISMGYDYGTLTSYRDGRPRFIEPACPPNPALSVGSTITLDDLAGRGGNYVTFDAKSGDVLTLDVDMTSSSSYLSVLVVSPSGSPLWSSHEADDPVDASSVTFGPTEVDETGTYIVVLDPPDSGTHTVQLGLTSEEVRTTSTLLLEASMPIDSSLRLNPSPGENVRVTFEGTVGQSLSIQAASTLEPDEIAVRVTAPGGERIWETTSFSARRDGGSWVFLDRVELFETGVYSINFDVGEGESREIDIELFDVTTPLPDSLDGVEIPLRLEGEISQPGQDLISAFQGSPGSLIGFELVATGLRTFDGSRSGIEVQITAPSGEFLWSGELSGDLESTPFVLNEAGNHIVVLDPVGPSVGTIEFSVVYCQPRQVLIDSVGNWEPCNPPNT